MCFLISITVLITATGITIGVLHFYGFELKDLQCMLCTLLVVMLALQFLDTTTITSSIYTHPSPSETEKSSEDSGRQGSITYFTIHTMQE